MFTLLLNLSAMNQEQLAAWLTSQIENGLTAESYADQFEFILFFGWGGMLWGFGGFFCFCTLNAGHRPGYLCRHE